MRQELRQKNSTRQKVGNKPVKTSKKNKKDWVCSSRVFGNFVPKNSQKHLRLQIFILSTNIINFFFFFVFFSKFFLGISNI